MVDVVHHTIVGSAGAAGAHALGHDDVALGFLLGSILPDLDVLFVMLGKSTFLRLHQGVTHSILGMPLLSLLAAALPSSAIDAGFVDVFVGCLAGMVVHVGLDLLNTFGVRVFWPLPARVSLGAFFFIDVYVLAASASALAALWTGCSVPAIGIAWIAFVAAYAAFRLFWKHLIRRRHGTATEVPSGVFPLTWFVTRKVPDAVEVGLVRGLRRTVEWSSSHRVAETSLLSTLRYGPIYSNLERSLKLFVPVSVAVDGATTIVRSRCVAVPNFGNRYGETVSTIVGGRVTDETARI